MLALDQPVQGRCLSARSSAVTAAGSTSRRAGSGTDVFGQVGRRGSFSGNSTGRAAGQMCRRYSAPGEGSNSEI